MKFCLQIILSFSVSKTANKAFLLTKWQHLSNKTNKIKMLIHLWFERADSRHRQTFCFCLAQHHKLLATSDYTQWANTHRWRKTSPEHMQTECTSHIIDTQNYTQRVRSRSEDRRARPGAAATVPACPRRRPEVSSPTARWRCGSHKTRHNVTSHPLRPITRHFGPFPTS